MMMMVMMAMIFNDDDNSMNRRGRLLLQLMVAFNIVSMSCFKLVRVSSSSSSSKHTRRSVSRDREGGLAADLPGGGSIREVTRRRR